VIGEGASLDDLTVIGTDVRIDPGSSLRGMRVPEPE
jgi:hypothetical protein